MRWRSRARARRSTTRSTCGGRWPRTAPGWRSWWRRAGRSGWRTCRARRTSCWCGWATARACTRRSSPRRHRAADGRLRLPRARARDGRHGGGERALRRDAARGPPMTPLFARLTIAGVGLVGGSLAAAVRAAGLADEVVGFGRTEANLRLAHERGLADRVTRDPAAAVAGADAIVLAAPVGACAALAAVFRPHARAGALLTDVGSVKRALVEELEAAWAGVGPVVGAHPVAGSEASGAGAARADLFRGRRCILTPTPATDRAALGRVRALWEGVGARVEELPPAVHDELLARVSHLPHLVAYALVAAVGEQTIAGRRAFDYAGSGFRDTTRVAASPAELWRDIALANAPALAAALGEFRAALDRLERLVSARDAAGLAAALAAARALRGRLGGEE